LKGEKRFKEKKSWQTKKKKGTNLQNPSKTLYSKRLDLKNLPKNKKKKNIIIKTKTQKRIIQIYKWSQSK
jgi:hypothetical protein